MLLLELQQLNSHLLTTWYLHDMTTCQQFADNFKTVIIKIHIAYCHNNITHNAVILPTTQGNFDTAILPLNVACMCYNVGIFDIVENKSTASCQRQKQSQICAIFVERVRFAIWEFLLRIVYYAKFSIVFIRIPIYLI